MQSEPVVALPGRLPGKQRIWAWSMDRVKFSLPNVGKGVKIFRVITGTEWITPLDTGRQSTPKNINKILYILRRV